MRASDAAGNLSSYSNVVSASTPATPDTTAPTAPGSLSASVISSTQINLSWTAATDNVGVTNYLIERCSTAGCANFAQVGTATGTTYNNTGLTASTSYSYRVRATDAAGNLSSYSNVVTALTSGAAGHHTTSCHDHRTHEPDDLQRERHAAGDRWNGLGRCRRHSGDVGERSWWQWYCERHY